MNKTIDEMIFDLVHLKNTISKSDNTWDCIQEAIVHLEYVKLEMENKPLIYAPTKERVLSLELIKEVIEKTKPLFIFGKLPFKTVHITKEEAIDFAKNYLNDRKGQYKHPTNIPIDNWTLKDHNDKIDHIMSCMIEYTIYDIIPYLYGEALD